MNNPVFYLIMRTDLLSLNSGKAMAQAVHAGNAVETHYENEVATNPSAIEPLMSAFHLWKHQTTQGFGTTIVLGGPMSQISRDISHLRKLGYLAAIVHDPTYPLTDGSVTHLIPLDTCAYVFAPDKDEPMLRDVLSKYLLHP
jgi:hypothetical protein